jgi:hypothetical protein
VYASDYESTTGQNLPGFYKRMRRGELLPHTAFEQWKYFGVGDGFYFVKEPSNCTATIQGWTYYDKLLDRGGYYNWDPDLPIPDTAVLVQRAAAAIYGKGYDALTFLAEFNKLIGSFTGLVSRFMRLLQKRRSGFDFGDLWMEYRYEWRTLYYDMVGFADNIENFNAERKRYSQRVGLTVKASKETPKTTHGGGVKFDWPVTSYVEISARGFVTADIKPPRFQFNPLTTAWELITLSFVIDWFLSVGDTLMAWSFMAFSSAHSASAGVLTTTERSLRVENVVPDPGYSANLTQQANLTIEHTVRMPTSIPLLPQFTVDLDLEKLRDLMYILRKLLTQSLRRP